MMAMGAATPGAHGQAMINTALVRQALHGARDRCSCATSSTIWDKTAADPTFSAGSIRAPGSEARVPTSSYVVDRPTRKGVLPHC